MSTQLEKSEVINKFKIFNSSLVDVFNPAKIEIKVDSLRKTYIELQIQNLLSSLYSDLLSFNSYEQIGIELNNSSSFMEEIKLQNENKTLNAYTKKAIIAGSTYVLAELDRLKIDFTEKLRLAKLKHKGKYEDVKVSEMEYALFIILAEKYGLISKVPKAYVKAEAFSVLTNISDQTLRDNIGGKYQFNPSKLLLKGGNLTTLIQTLENIRDETVIIRDKLTI